MDPDHIVAITEWPVLQDVYEVQIFLGFANFYRRFINGYSRITFPITLLLRKGQRFHWSSICQAAFDEFKHHFMTALILKHFDLELSIHLHTDASSFAISGILRPQPTPWLHMASGRLLLPQMHICTMQLRNP